MKRMLGSWWVLFPMAEAHTGFLSVWGLPGFLISGTLGPLAPLDPRQPLWPSSGLNLCIPEQSSQSERVVNERPPPDPWLPIIGGK